MSTSLSVRHLSISFAGTRALDDVSLDVGDGEVHALLGHNGSGKSSLIKILCGTYQPDPGSEITIGGEPLPSDSPTAAERLGLRAVHQNLALVPSLSVTENIAMGAGYGRGGMRAISWRRENERAAQQMSKLGYDVDPRLPVGSLSASASSAVAIARALIDQPGRSKPRVLLLDEVTATMPEPEIQRLLELVRTLAADGVAVVYVSHHLEEAMEVADNVTLLRDGKLIRSAPIAEVTLRSLADLVAGGTEWREHIPLADVRSVSPRAASSHVEVVKLRGDTLKELTFDASPGRIVGIAGITGSGRDEVARLIHGGLARGGSVALDGTTVPSGNPRSAVRMGMTLVPADRHANAVIPTQNIRENLTLSVLGRTRRLAPIKLRSERSTVKGWLSRLSIRGATVEGSISTLSGGNQQKVILARCLHARPRALVLDEPTQGVDIGAVAEIHALVRQLSADSAVIVCSSDSYELASLCTEVVILYRGRKVGHISGADVTEANIDRLQLSPPISSSHLVPTKEAS